jgi:Ca2+-binding EF-hand superfamily protein
MRSGVCCADGSISREEARRGLRALRIPYTAAGLERFIRLMDHDEDDRITRAEFVAFVLMRQERLRKTFEEFDADQTGTISVGDLRQLCDSLGIALSARELARLIELGDRNGDGVLDVDEFCRLLMLMSDVHIAGVFEQWIAQSAIEAAEVGELPVRDTGLPLWASFLAGALAGAVSRTATAPMDRVRTMLQAGTPDLERRRPIYSRLPSASMASYATNGFSVAGQLRSTVTADALQRVWEASMPRSRLRSRSTWSPGATARERGSLAPAQQFSSSTLVSLHTPGTNSGTSIAPSAPATSAASTTSFEASAIGTSSGASGASSSSSLLSASSSSSSLSSSSSSSSSLASNAAATAGEGANGALFISQNRSRSASYSSESATLRSSWSPGGVARFGAGDPSLSAPSTTPSSFSSSSSSSAGASTAGAGAGVSAGDGGGPAARRIELAVVDLPPNTVAAAGSRSAAAPQRRGQARLLKAVRFIYQESGVVGFWRSNGTNLLKIVPETAVRFAAFEAAKKVLARDGANAATLQPWERFTAGAMAGVVATIAIYPLDMAKTRIALSSVGLYQGPWHCLTRIARDEGPRALFRGLGASVIGIVPYSGTELMVYSLLKDAWSAHYPDAEPSTLALLASGAVATTIGQFVAYPLQLARTRLQAQGMPGRPVIFRGPLDCIHKTLVAEGVRGLYRGIFAGFLKSIPAVGISFVTFEHSKRFLRAVHNQHLKDKKKAM